MATPIDILLEEHRLIERATKVLLVVGAKMERGEPVPPDSFEQIFDFLDSFADRRHHGKEERCMFPALATHGVQRDRGPVGIMLQEHCSGRALIAHMKRAAAQYEQSAANAGRRFAEHARDYTALLTEHIDKEDNVLFRIAQSLLDEPAMLTLQAEFDRMEPDRAAAFERYKSELGEMELAWIKAA